MLFPFRYDKIEAKVVREFRRHGVTPENPDTYTARYGDSLLDTQDLLFKVKELGITEDLVSFRFDSLLVLKAFSCLVITSCHRSRITRTKSRVQ